MFDRLITFFAKQLPHNLAVSSLAGHLTYAELDANIDRFAAALAEQDVPRPGVVAVVVADPYVHWLFLLALARLGVTSASYLSVQRRQMEPLLGPGLVISDEAEDPSDAERPRILRVTPDWLNAVGARPAVPLPFPDIDPDGPARIATSSGTTGTPKKFAVSWKGVQRRIERNAILQGAVRTSRVLSLVGPAHTPFPGSLGIWGVGGTVLFGPNDPVVLAHALTRLRPDVISMAPMQLKALLDALPEGFPPMRELSLMVAGSHTPPSVREEARARLTPFLVVAYGTTEAGGVAMRPDLGVGDDADVGWVLPWIEVEIVDEDDKPVPFESLGAVRVRGEGVITGYLDDEEASARFFQNGWFYPGDVGSLTARGRLRVEGRTDEVMNFGGAKFMPHTIEAAVMACPGVVDAGAFTMIDAAGFMAPWIAVVRGEGLSEQAIAEALMLPGLPPAHVVWTDVIPRTATGKVHRDQLQAASKALAGER
jgi:2,3-dihydroxybenzoate-AMP ligase